MSLSVHEIEAEILTLPKQEQQEVADFVEFLKAKLARRQAKRLEAHQQTEGARENRESELLVDIAKTLPKIACFENKDPLKLQKAMREDNDTLENKSEQTASPIYQAFEKSGLIGCIETDEQLSTTYKGKKEKSC